MRSDQPHFRSGIRRSVDFSEVTHLLREGGRMQTTSVKLRGPTWWCGLVNLKPSISLPGANLSALPSHTLGHSWRWGTDNHQLLLPPWVPSLLVECTQMTDSAVGCLKRSLRSWPFISTSIDWSGRVDVKPGNWRGSNLSFSSLLFQQAISKLLFTAKLKMNHNNITAWGSIVSTKPKRRERQ